MNDYVCMVVLPVVPFIYILHVRRSHRTYAAALHLTRSPPISSYSFINEMNSLPNTQAIWYAFLLHQSENISDRIYNCLSTDDHTFEMAVDWCRLVLFVVQFEKVKNEAEQQRLI